MAASTDSRDLEGRIDALETLAVRSLVLVTAALLVVSAIVPVYSGIEEDLVPTLRFAPGPFQAFAAVAEQPNHGLTLTTGLLLALVDACLVSALVVGVAQWHRSAGAGMVRFAKLVSWGLVLVVLFAVFIVLGVAGEEEPGEVGPALWVLIPAALLFMVQARSASLRRLWTAER